MTHTRVGSIGVIALASFVGGAVADVMLTGRVQARAQAPVVTTQQLNLVDGAGRLRAILSAEDERGWVSLSLFDAFHVTSRRSASEYEAFSSHTNELPIAC